MHPNPVFHDASLAQNLNFVRNRTFGHLSLNGPQGPITAHAPILLSEDGKTADLHMMRSNPVVRALAAPQPALFSTTGPDGYISPDWYDAPAQVPTWNYVAVHLRGQLALLAQDTLLDVLTRQSAAFEARLAPKPAWHLNKVPQEALSRMMRMIVPLRLTIESVDGTWKLGQNKPEAARLRAATELTSGFGHELAALSQLMRAISPDI